MLAQKETVIPPQESQATQRHAEPDVGTEEVTGNGERLAGRINQARKSLGIYKNDSQHKLKRAMVSPLLHPLGAKLMCPHPDCPEYTSLRLRILNFSIRLKSEGRA
jgi:hypothetical protein